MLIVSEAAWKGSLLFYLKSEKSCFNLHHHPACSIAVQ